MKNNSKKQLTALFLFFLFILSSISLPIFAEEEYEITDLVLTPGKNASELNIAWYTPENPSASIVQIAKRSDMTDTSFPVDKAMTFVGNSSFAFTGLSTNKVTVTDLTDSTEYVYRVGDGKDENWSPVYLYTTRNPKDFGFFFVGDPQIGYADSNAEARAWEDTLKKATNKFPDASFLLSAGDQVQSNKISLYNLFFQPETLRNLPIVPAQGNHDTGSLHYSTHFNLPNTSQYGKTSNGGEDGDYFFVYGNTLFMCLNTNNQYSGEHNAFMREAVAKNPNVKWKVLLFHHSIYSTTSHYTGSYVQRFIDNMCPTIEDLKIDLVLMGHDHVYVRTYQMKNNAPQKEQTVDEYGNVINPTGVLYITGNSATGSKYYEIELTNPAFAAVNEQIEIPTFSYISVNNNKLSIQTYRTDTMEMVDAYSIIKQNPLTNAPNINLDQFCFMKDDLEIDEIKLDETEGEVYGNVVLSNDSPDTYTCVPVLALYNKDDELIKIKSAEETVIPACTKDGDYTVTSIKTPSISLSDIQPGQSLKLFLWDNLAEFTPYTSAIQLFKTEETTPPQEQTSIKLECEDLAFSVFGAEEKDSYDSAFSGGAASLFEAQKTGDYIEYDVFLPSSGTWNIRLLCKAGENSGKFRLYLPQSEKYVGTEEHDQYSSKEEIKTIDIGKYKFNSAGVKKFRLILTGKNDASYGYQLNNDAILLTKAD